MLESTPKQCCFEDVLTEDRTPQQFCRVLGQGGFAGARESREYDNLRLSRRLEASTLSIIHHPAVSSNALSHPCALPCRDYSRRSCLLVRGAPGRLPR